VVTIMAGPRGERQRRASGDGGAALVEFVLMSVLLVLLLFAVLQVALYFYARNVIASAAADGARYAANAGVDPGSGAHRAAELIAGGLNASAAGEVPCTSAASTDAASGLATVTVRCRGRMPLLLLPLQLPLTIDVQSSVLQETPP
jgi:Flp pilus assembly protein TadG